MTDALTDKKRAYLRAYYEKNKELIREKQREYYKNNAHRIIECVREYRQARPDEARERRQDHYAANKADYIKRANDYRAANPEKVRENKRRYASLNLAQGAQKTRKRRAAKMQRVPTWFGEFDEFVAQEAYALAARRTNSRVVWHVDHLFPLQGLNVSGLHCGLNLQVIPALLNFQKRNELQLTQPLEWLHHV